VRSASASGGLCSGQAGQSPEFDPPVHEGADIGGQLSGGSLRIARTVLGGVEVDAAGNVACLHDIARHLGVVDLAPYFTCASVGVF